MRFLRNGLQQRILGVELLPEDVPVAWTDYTPELTAVTTDPTLGSGSAAQGRWCYIGKLAIVHIRIVFGTSGVVAGSGVFRVSLPFTLDANIVRQGSGSGYLWDNSAADAFAVVADSRANQNYVEMWIAQTITGGQVTHAAPIPWAASDEIHLNLNLEMA